jgi:hypothetical protein
MSHTRPVRHLGRTELVAVVAGRQAPRGLALSHGMHGVRARLSDPLRDHQAATFSVTSASSAATGAGFFGPRRAM